MQKKRLFASFAVTALVAGSLVATTSVATAATRSVTVWSPYKGGNLDMWNAAIKRIEAENPGLKVTSVGSIDMAKSLAAINAGTGPDISVSNGNGNLGWFCGSGAAELPGPDVPIVARRGGGHDPRSPGGSSHDRQCGSCPRAPVRPNPSCDPPPPARPSALAPSRQTPPPHPDHRRGT